MVTLSRTTAFFKKVKTSDAELNTLQNNIEEYLKMLPIQTPFLTGKLVSTAVLTTDTVIVHGMGKPYQGYLVLDKNADASIYTSSSGNPRPKDQIILKASQPVTVTLWIF